MDSWPQREHRRAVDATPAEVLARIAEAAEMWGAEWSERGVDGSGGTLSLPVVAGIRRGFVRGRLDVAAGRGPRGAAGAELVYDVEEAWLEVHRPALAILLVAGAGGSTSVIWPFYPAILPLVPVGAVLALGAWFLVVSKLRTSGPEDFLELVGELAAPADG